MSTGSRGNCGGSFTSPATQPVANGPHEFAPTVIIYIRLNSSPGIELRFDLLSLERLGYAFLGTGRQQCNIIMPTNPFEIDS